MKVLIYRESWRTTADEDRRYYFAVALCCQGRALRLPSSRLRRFAVFVPAFTRHARTILTRLAFPNSRMGPASSFTAIVISNILEIWLTAAEVERMIPAMKIEEAAARLEALGNPTRLKIYRTLVRAGHAGMPVGRLQERLKIPASTLSHHVKALVSVGLICQVRESTTLVCHAEYDTMRGLLDFLVAECCADEAECKEDRTAA